MRSRQPARPGNHGAREAVPLYRSHRSPREPEESPGKTGGEGKVGRLTVVGDGETLTRPDNNRRGGEDGGRDQARLGRKTAWSFRNVAAAPDPAAAAAPGRRLPPLLCFDSIDHVTLSHETRICPLPRAAAQQIAAARDPSGPSAEHARAPRLPSVSGEAGRTRALRERASRYLWSVERRLQFRLGVGVCVRSC